MICKVRTCIYQVFKKLLKLKKQELHKQESRNKHFPTYNKSAVDNYLSNVVCFRGVIKRLQVGKALSTKFKKNRVVKKG